MSKNPFTRLKEIPHTVKPYEISLITNDNGLGDSIHLRGENLQISLDEVDYEYEFIITMSDKRGLSLTIPCSGVELINEYRNDNKIITEVYLYLFYDGIGILSIKGIEDIIANTDREVDYNNLIIQAKSCRKCDAMKEAEAIIGNNNGNLNADIMFIAEAPGPRGADITGIPLHGDVTGDNFEKLLCSTKWTRSDIYITNAVLCCPTNENGTVRNPTKQEVKNCHPYLSRIIDLVNPKIVVTLGKKALEAIKEIENHPLVLSKDVASYTRWNNRWVYPLYHPSPQVINTGTRTFEQQKTDFRQLEHNYKQRILKGKEPISFQKR